MTLMLFPANCGEDSSEAADQVKFLLKEAVPFAVLGRVCDVWPGIELAPLKNHEEFINHWWVVSLH